jgi:hypothetical protein
MEELLQCVPACSDIIGTLQVPGRAWGSKRICWRTAMPWKAVRANGYALTAQRFNALAAVVERLGRSKGCIGCCWCNVPEGIA